MNELDMTKPISLDMSQSEIETRLLQETDIARLNEIIKIFNLNIKRKNLVRTSKCNELQDKIVDQMYMRIDQHADEFSNDELLKYHESIQKTVDKSDTAVNENDIPQIQINQQVNIGDEALARLNADSRNKVKDVVNRILAMNNTDFIVEEVDTIGK